jgi:hypothetical protein
MYRAPCISRARSAVLLGRASPAVLLNRASPAVLLNRARPTALPVRSDSDPHDPPPERPGAVRQVAVPGAVRALCTLSRIDYEDAFLLETPAAQDRTAEQWARAILEEAPSALRGSLRRGWLALGLELGPSGAERFVLGWEVRRSARDFVLLGARSRIGMPAELLFKREPSAVLISTFVQQDNPLARALWAGIEPFHQRVVPHVLRQGAR